jgi:hypothetical protein
VRVRDLVADPALADVAGMPIFTADQAGADLALAPTSAPKDGDQVLESESAREFLEPEAAVLLSNQVLDGDIGAAGAAWHFTCHEAQSGGNPS